MRLSLFPAGESVGGSLFLRALLGNIATSLWFLPQLALALHRWRGVKISRAATKTIFLGRNVTIDNRFPHLVTIGDDVWITVNCVVLAHSYASRTQREAGLMVETTAPVVIEDGAFVGAGSVILPGARLGKACYIAAGSVVSGEIPPGMLAAGNPARVIRPLGESRP